MILDPHQPNAWLIYAFVMTGYTLITFGFSFTRKGTSVFSSRKGISTSTIIRRHVVFLAILLAFMGFAFYIDPFLPSWFSEPVYENRRGKPVAVSQVLFFLALLVLGVVERRWIFVEVDPDSSDSEEESS